MSKVDFQLNLKGLNQLMTSSQMAAATEAAGEKVAQIAQSQSGGQYEVTTNGGYWLVFTHVKCADMATRVDNYKNNTLLKSLQASGLDMTKKGRK